MFQRTKDLIVDNLQEACFYLHGVVDRSIDEDHALDEIGEALGHIKDIEVNKEPALREFPGFPPCPGG